MATTWASPARTASDHRDRSDRGRAARGEAGEEVAEAEGLRGSWRHARCPRPRNGQRGECRVPHATAGQRLRASTIAADPLDQGPVWRYRPIMHRSCARPACADPAVAILSYDYAASTVWILPLDAESGPMAHGMCNRHAGTLVVPRGWTLDDRRSVDVDPPGEALAS